MSTTPIDIEALAKKYGGSVVEPTAAKPTIDIEALAKKYGGSVVSSTPSTSTTPQTPGSLQTPTPAGSPPAEKKAPGLMSKVGDVAKKAASIPLEKGVAQGMGLDPSKVMAQPTMMGQVKEAGSEYLGGMKQWGLQVLKDPFHIVDPVNFMANTMSDGGREVFDGILSGDKDKIKHGTGLLIGGTASILGGAESADKVGKGAVKAAYSSGDFGEAAVHGRQVVEKSTAMLDKSAQDSKAALSAVNARVNHHVDTLVKDIASADVADSKTKGLPGSVDTKNLAIDLRKHVADTNSGKLDLPQVKEAAKQMFKKGPTMTWEDLKDYRTTVAGLMSDASGKEKVILTRLYEDVSNGMKVRAAQLGLADQFVAYHDLTKGISQYLNGVLGNLYNADNGISFFDELRKASKGAALKNLNADFAKYGLPKDFFQDLVDSHKNIHWVVKSADRSGGTGMIVSRMQALGHHPVVAGAAATAGFAAPLPGKLVWSMLAAAKAADVADKMGALKEIRKLGGDVPTDGLFRDAPGVDPKGPGPTPPSPPPQLGTGGPPSSPTQTPPNTGTPASPTAPSTPQKMLSIAPGTAGHEQVVAIVKAIKKESQTGEKSAKIGASDITSNKEWMDDSRKAESERLKGVIRNSKATAEEKTIAASQLKEHQDALKATGKPTEPVTAKRVAEGEHAKEPSVKGGTKDTIEARRAKARERMAAGRATAKSQQPTASKMGGKPIIESSKLDNISTVELEEAAAQIPKGSLVVSAARKMVKAGKLTDEMYKETLKEFLTSKFGESGYDVKK